MVRNRAIETKHLAEDYIEHWSINIVHIDLDAEIAVAVGSKIAFNGLGSNSEAFSYDILLTNLA
jgi:hypothetical protein